MFSMAAIHPQTPRVYPPSVICAGLDAPAKEQMFLLSDTRRVRAKETVFYEADPCENFYEVVRGVIGLYKLTPDGRRQVVGFAYPGQLLGLGFQAEYAYTAEVVSEATVCRYPRKKLERIMEECPSLGRRLLAMTASDLVAAHDQMLLLGRKTAPEKLVTFLLRLSGMNEKRGEDPCKVHLPMKRGDIADYLGLTTETVSRLFSRLKRARIIDLRQTNHVVLRDMERMREIAEGDECCVAA